MSKISDELRKKAKQLRNSRVSVRTYRSPSEYERLADRIDSEMVELPRDKDGVPINLGDEVCLDGKYGHVTRIDYRIDNERYVIFWSGSECIVCMGTELAELTHERPDSWERIADELDEMVDTADSADDSCEKLANLAERIRRLAKEDDK